MFSHASVKLELQPTGLLDLKILGRSREAFGETNRWRAKLRAEHWPSWHQWFVLYIICRSGTNKHGTYHIIHHEPYAIKDDHAPGYITNAFFLNGPHETHCGTWIVAWTTHVRRQATCLNCWFLKWICHYKKNQPVPDNPITNRCQRVTLPRWTIIHFLPSVLINHPEFTCSIADYLPQIGVVYQYASNIAHYQP